MGMPMRQMARISRRTFEMCPAFGFCCLVGTTCGVMWKIFKTQVFESGTTDCFCSTFDRHCPCPLDNVALMSAAQVIDEIKHLPPAEQGEVPGMRVCGECELVKTFLQPMQTAVGDELN